MQFNEPNPVLRRIPVYLETELGIPVTGATPAGSQIRVSKSGAVFANGAGSFSEVGAGNYIYQATQVETQTKAYLFLLVTWPGAIPFPFAVDIGERVASGETDPEARRIPIYLEDFDRTPMPGLVLTGAEVQLSIGGAPFANGLGVVGVSGFGGYFYEPTILEIDGQGLRILKVTDPAAMIYDYAFDVVAGAAEVIPPPVPVPFPVVFGDPTFIDHVQAGLARLCEQFIGDPIS